VDHGDEGQIRLHPVAAHDGCRPRRSETLAVTTNTSQMANPGRASATHAPPLARATAPPHRPLTPDRTDPHVATTAGHVPDRRSGGYRAGKEEVSW
jgi:hypothetical protein